MKFFYRKRSLSLFYNFFRRFVFYLAVWDIFLITYFFMSFIHIYLGCYHNLWSTMEYFLHIVYYQWFWIWIGLLYSLVEGYKKSMSNNLKLREKNLLDQSPNRGWLIFLFENPESWSSFKLPSLIFSVFIED